MNVLSIGGSRNIGYYATQRLLAVGSTVTYLLRNVSTLENDEATKTYVASGKAKLVSGDALNEEDVKKAWNIATNDNKDDVDLVLFTVGGTPKFSLLKGFVITPANLCTSTMLNLIATYPRTQSPQPKLILVSSTGLDKASHKNLPLVLKPLYSYALAEAHADKCGMERVASYAAGWEWKSEEPQNGILPPGWKERLPEPGFLKKVLVLRPAIFTDGECKGDKSASGVAAYRVSGERDLSGSYTISRKDVAHFIVEGALRDWDQWEGKTARIAY